MQESPEFEPLPPSGGKLTLMLSAEVLRSPCSLALQRLERELLRGGNVEVVLSADTLESMMITCRRLAPSVLIICESELEDARAEAISAQADYGDAVRVLVLVSQKTPAKEMHYVRMGCSGCISTNSSMRVIRRAIHAVLRGEIWISRFAVSRLLRFCLQSESANLTERERTILSLVGQGQKNDEVARSLCISSETVRWHLRHLYRKLGTHDRERAAHLAEAFGLEDADSPHSHMLEGGS